MLLKFNWLLATNHNFLILISWQPNVVNFEFLNYEFFKIKFIKVLNIKGLLTPSGYKDKRMRKVLFAGELVVFLLKDYIKQTNAIIDSTTNFIFQFDDFWSHWHNWK